MGAAPVLTGIREPGGMVWRQTEPHTEQFKRSKLGGQYVSKTPWLERRLPSPLLLPSQGACTQVGLLLRIISQRPEVLRCYHVCMRKSLWFHPKPS